MQWAKANLARYPGSTKEIDGRSYLNFNEYAAWRGRSVFVAKSWNSWVDANGGEGAAELAGVKVRKLTCYADDYGFTVHDTAGVEVKLKERNKLLDSLRMWTLHDFNKEEGRFARVPPYERTSYRDRAWGWREEAASIVVQAYMVKGSMDRIS